MSPWTSWTGPFSADRSCLTAGEGQGRTSGSFGRFRPGPIVLRIASLYNRLLDEALPAIVPPVVAPTFPWRRGSRRGRSICLQICVFLDTLTVEMLAFLGFSLGGLWLQVHIWIFAQPLWRAGGRKGYGWTFSYRATTMKQSGVGKVVFSRPRHVRSQQSLYKSCLRGRCNCQMLSQLTQTTSKQTLPCSLSLPPFVIRLKCAVSQTQTHVVHVREVFTIVFCD